MDELDLVGASSAIRSVIADCDCIAASRSKVLITGESGVGKEVFARYIHRHSSRRQAPMISVNCAGVPESLLESEFFGHVRGSFTDAHRDRRGILEAAHRGTVLLDEIGEMGMRMQALLLRFLETGEIQRVGADQPVKALDVRLIAATNRDLRAETRRKTFREDLYFRLNVVHLAVPPLRERREDVRPLLLHFLRLTSAAERRPVPTISADALAFLESYRWPGNVRELKNVAERLMVRYSGAEVAVRDLPDELMAAEADVDSEPAPRLWQCEIDEAYDRMTIVGESFWTAVFEPFTRHDMTREALRAIVRRGLERMHGSYPRVAVLFNLPEDDHRKFMRFLHKYDCHMPVQPFRRLPQADLSSPRMAERASA